MKKTEENERERENREREKKKSVKGREGCKAGRSSFTLNSEVDRLFADPLT